jgi:5'-methylthioadenosine phosphorylase
VMEGPLFSTKAESNLYRSWGASVVGMTALPEAKLAREAEMCYATLAFVTDYDCWRQATDIVTIEMVIENLQRNVDMSKEILKKAVPRIPKERECLCATALENAIITHEHVVPIALKEKFHLLIGKYMPPY